MGNHIDYGARGLDTRTARWQTHDPYFAAFPGESPYSYASNSPIQNIDVDGLFRFNKNNANNVLSGDGGQVDVNQFIDYLKNGITLVQCDEVAMKNLSELGSQTIETILKELTWGNTTGPEIILEDLHSGAFPHYGDTYPQSSPIQWDVNKRNIIIDYRLVVNYQNASAENKSAALLNLVSIILHELTHYNDHVKYPGKFVEEQGGEIGHCFEYRTYGFQADESREDLNLANSLLQKLVETNRNTEAFRYRSTAAKANTNGKERPNGRITREIKKQQDDKNCRKASRRNSHR